jgi:hypothetical protein
VADAEADIHDYLRECIKNNHQFVIRMCQDRVIIDEETRDRLGSLFEVAHAAPAVAGYTLKLRARPGQARRVAQLSVSFVAVCVRAPAHQGRAGEPVSCWLVRAWEEHPPAGVEPLEWVLAVGFPVATAADALRAVGIYSQRSVIEEFHKGLKTGMGAERLQLETAERLYAAIAIMSVVTLRLLDLRERAWLNPEAPAEQSGLNVFGARPPVPEAGPGVADGARCDPGGRSAGRPHEPQGGWSAGLVDVASGNEGPAEPGRRRAVGAATAGATGDRRVWIAITQTLAQ